MRKFENLLPRYRVTLVKEAEATFTSYPRYANSLDLFQSFREEFAVLVEASDRAGLEEILHPYLKERLKAWLKARPVAGEGDLGAEAIREVRGANRSVGHGEAGLALDLVGRDARRAELRDDHPPVRDHTAELFALDAPHQLGRAEGSFAGGAPDVDSLGVERKDPS